MALNIPMMKDVQRKLDDVLLKTRENLTGVRVLRAFCREDEEIEQFYASNKILTKKQKKSGHVSGLLNPLTYVLINIAIILLINSGALQVAKGNLTQGEVVALYNYMSQILVELVKLANLIVTLNKAMASANRLGEVFAIEPSMKDGEVIETKSQTDSYIEFRNVALKYKGAQEESLSNINFTVKKGQTVGIIGGTGCGKTSLVHLITRYYDATNGEVLFEGKNVKDLKQDYLRKKIGIVMQKAVLFKGSIRDNLKWGKEDATEEELMQAVTDAQALDVVEKKGGLDAEVEQNGRNFSGGQKQRLSIARALVGKPDILIFDDSSSALDYATDAALRTALKNLSHNPTVFMVSQRTSSIQHADLILVLEDGELVGTGTHEELLASCDVYREIYESQYKKEEN